MLASTALVLCAHGVDGGPGVAAEHADALRRRGLFADVVACCLNGTPSMADAIGRVDSEQITIVPTLMAGGVTARRLFREAAIDSRVTVTNPVGTHPTVSELVSRCAHNACRARGWATMDTELVLVGHGTSRDANSGRALVDQRRRLVSEADFRSVRVAFLEQTPRFEAVLAELGPAPAVVVGYFADRGVHGETDLRRLVATGGRSVCYAGPIGIEPGVQEIILDLARGAAQRPAARHAVSADALATIAPPGSPPARETPPVRPA